MEDFNMMMIHRWSTYMKPTLLESGKRGSARLNPDNIDLEGGTGAEYFDEEDVGQKEDYDEYYDPELHIRVKRESWKDSRDSRYHSKESSSESRYYPAIPSQYQDSCQMRRDAYPSYRCGDLCTYEEWPFSWWPVK